MPRLAADKPPRYRLHRSSGQAVVTLSGEDHFLGPYNSKPSWELYNRKLAEWYAAGRASLRSRDSHDITVAELCNAYRKFAEGYYVKNGKQTATVYRVKAMIKFLRAGYARNPANEFGPLALQALQRQLASDNLSRKYCNDIVDSVKAMFRWASNQSAGHLESSSPTIRRSSRSVGTGPPDESQRKSPLE